MTKTLYDKLEYLHLCPEAIPYLKQFDDDKIAECWDICERGDWMLRLLGDVNYDDDNTLRKIAVRCAARVTHLMDDKRSLDALDVAWAHAHGRATDDELAAAHAAAADAAAKAAWAVVGAAADAAAKAADAAAKAAWAVVWAAADAAAVWGATDTMHSRQADIIREYISGDDVAKLFDDEKGN